MEKLWDNVKLFWAKTNRWHRVFLIFLLVELRLVPGGQVGFWCNDPALSHPFTGDTINWKWLFVTTIFLPLPVMLLVERKYHSDEKSEGRKSRVLVWYKEYLFGLLINVTVVQSLKVLVGSPRPHFFDTCQPAEAMSCQVSEYVPRYSCTKAVWQHQSDKSFPSGHSSLAIHAGVFVAYYMSRRTERTRATLGLQSICVFSSIFCCLSRMSDHRHHWWDVLAGAALAAPILLYTIFYLCRNFECPDTICESPETDKTNIPASSQSQFVTHSNNETVVHSQIRK